WWPRGRHRFAKIIQATVTTPPKPPDELPAATALILLHGLGLGRSRPRRLSALRHLPHSCAGAGGGMVSMALTYPLVTVSTRAQVNNSKTSKDGKSGDVSLASQVRAFRTILAEEGVAGLYSGINSALFGIAVTQGVYYYWYEFVKAGFETAG
ncbi:hypothetical protein HK405_001577, partial [Cladochytrium tenue]